MRASGRAIAYRDFAGVNDDGSAGQQLERQETILDRVACRRGAVSSSSTGIEAHVRCHQRSDRFLRELCSPNTREQPDNCGHHKRSFEHGRGQSHRTQAVDTEGSSKLRQVIVQRDSIGERRRVRPRRSCRPCAVHCRIKRYPADVAMFARPATVSDAGRWLRGARFKTHRVSAQDPRRQN